MAPYRSPQKARLSQATPPIRPRRPPYRAARAFYLVLLIGACIATYALLSQPVAEPLELQQSTLHRRDISPLLNDDEKCRLVHRAKDQCAFVKSQCPTDEGGFAAYLDLYFCRLPHAKAVAFTILILWLGLLFSTIGIAASDFFCINLSTIATILGMSESMAGVTFLAFGNGSPDVFSTFAAMSTNSGSLAVGELFGAAGFITAVVAGSMALIRPFTVARKSFIRDVGFFVVAAAFSIVFLWDGKLHLWECLVMVAFYVFYVAFVVLWHWWIGRRRRRREKEAAARGHFIPPGDELDIEEEYRDDPDDETARPSFSRGVSREDWSALERGETYQDISPNEDDEEEARDRWMSELNSNMRLTRPPARSRKNTLTPVRPSLVGALEFQAVLKSLQKSRNIQTYPLNARRYSDDPTYTSAQIQDNMSTLSDPAARPPYQVAVHEDRSPTVERPNTLDVPKSAPARTRAVSANDAASLRIDPDLRRSSQDRSREQDDLMDFSPGGTPAQSLGSDTLQVPQDNQLRPSSPAVSPGSQQRPSINTAVSGTESRDFLAPPSAGTLPRQDSLELPDSAIDSHSPRSVPHAKQLPRISIPGRPRSPSSTPGTSPFPRYHDDSTPPTSRPPSLYLPPASIASPESVPVGQSTEEEVPKRPSLLSRWWPYNVLPPPGVMISTLFPTIYHWPDKNYWEKALGLVAAPSVFLLKITLPVVESGKDEDEAPSKDDSYDSSRSKSTPALKTPGSLDLNAGTTPGGHHHGSFATQGATGKGTAATVATSQEQNYRHNMGSHASQQSRASRPSIIIEDQVAMAASPQIMPTNSLPLSPGHAEPPEPWNRWLLITQLFLAPLFIVFSIYSQSPNDVDPLWLLEPILICLLVSLVTLIPLLLTTTPTRRPPFHRPILSLVGFVVSIAWISTIASQVVGALKALAVIANMSHAIMGLTIFAVGNSLGDLVADVTVARLGYPVMALSACFGGPMLNILLGIGISGSYIIIRHANHRVNKHPDKDFKFQSYHIEVGNTLIVSGGTLLVTLVGLLIAVPMNKWVLSKKIGWALIAVWVLSTIGNVVLEVTGIADGGHED